MLSPDGRSKTFDRSADGFGRGEGCGVVAVARCSAASRPLARIAGALKRGHVEEESAVTWKVCNGSACTLIYVLINGRQVCMQIAGVDIGAPRTWTL